MNTLQIGLIGDRDDSVAAHLAIPIAVSRVASRAGLSTYTRWLPTSMIDAATRLSAFHALWCVPGSPYHNAEGALNAITYARESDTPFLGTCGGFQHAVLEFARNVVGWTRAEHAETAPHAAQLVISPMACALVDQSEAVTFTPGSRIAQAYGSLQAVETYHCRYGINPAFETQLTDGALQVTARDASGAVRAVELRGHPFYVATLFQPELAALDGAAPPLVEALLQAAAQRFS